jgi:putative MATE family efflux protein
VKKKMNLLEDNILKLFFKFAATSTAGMLMVSLYILFDTIIVGHGVGKDGLAALNISIPIYNLIFGTGILLGTGGATAMSISIGAARKEKANKAFNHAIILGIVIGAVYTIFGMLFLEDIAYLLGASPQILPLVKEYLGVIILFSWSFLMVYNLAAIVRNDHGPKRAMIALGAGGVVNVVFDYIFVFPLGMGMKGTAIATVMSSITSLLILLFHFIGGHSSFKVTSFKLQFSLINRILAIGLASFIVEVSSGMVIFLVNRELLSRVGEIGVSAYSIIANVSLMCVAIFTGIAQGIQPILSTNYGAEKYRRV